MRDKREREGTAGSIKIKEKNKFRDSCVTSDKGRITIRAWRLAELRRPPGSYVPCLSFEFRVRPGGRIVSLDAFTSLYADRSSSIASRISRVWIGRIAPSFLFFFFALVSFKRIVGVCCRLNCR